MQKTSFFPPFIRTLSVLFIGTLLALVLARGAMLGILWPEVAGNPASDILNALYIGTKFDIRMVVLGLIPIALILGIPPLERLLVRSRGFRGLIDLLYATVFAAATLVYIIDFGWFFYMHTRVDASLFELLGDPDIAGTMVWESYPVVWITFGLIVVTALYALFFGKTLARHEATPRLGWKGRTGWSVATFAILFLLGYGQISSNLFPLRWSNAFFSVDKNISILALNPIQNLFDTVNAAQGTRPNIEATRESYPRVAAWLRVPNPDPQKLNFMRTAHGIPAEQQEKPLNVVVIIMESHDMAAHVLLAQPDRHSRGHHAEPDGPLQGFAVLPAVLRADAHHRPRHLHHHDRHPGREPLRRHQFPQSGTGGSGADDE